LVIGKAAMPSAAVRTSVTLLGQNIGNTMSIIGNWHRFSNRRRVGSFTGLCPGEDSSGNTRIQRCVTKHGNPRLRAALVEAA